MDLNGDGYSDILSGSYSRQTSDMAGTFQVLWGTEDGFQVAETLNGTDDEPLIIPAEEADIITKICTRPFAADIDNDGDLDLVVGNFGGTFYLFSGEGEGKFQPQPEKMKAGDNALHVKHHSDPCLFDWDNDGDLDIVSGSSEGGVSVAINQGDAGNARFTAFQSVIDAKPRDFNKVTLGDEHINGPQGSTRVWVDDVNDDGKFDLLVGDSVVVSFAAEGVEEDEVEAKLKAWNEKQEGLMEQYQELAQKVEVASAKEAQADQESGETAESTDESAEGEASENESAESEPASELAKLQEQLEKCQSSMSDLYAERGKIIREDYTGYVWVYYQK